MTFNGLNEKEYQMQLKYFNDYYGAEFRFGQGTEELLDMINKYSIDGDLIDFGSGSNIYFWLIAFNDITKVKCVDISKEAFYINEQIKNKEIIGKSFDYPMDKYDKSLDEVLKIKVDYYIKDMLNGDSIFTKKANNVSQFGLLGLCKTKDKYFKNFKRLFSSLKENGVFLGANWIFSESYGINKKFKNDYLDEIMIEELATSLNSECLYVKKVKIKDDPNYDYVLIYAIRKHRQYSMMDIQKMRLINNGVLNKFENVDDCVISLLGIQSQYYNYALISLYNRVKKMNLNCLSKNKNIIKSWGQRTTLHLYHKKDYNMISSLYADKYNWIKKYAKGLDINLNEYLDLINNYMKKKGIATKNEIENILPEKYRKDIMQWSGLLIEATYQKLIYGIINDKDEKIYKINDIAENDFDINDLFERYFKYYGPATISDFLHWSGFRKCDIANEINNFISNKHYINFEEEKYYYIGKLPNIKQYKCDNYIALGKFDPLLVSYNNKKWILDNYDSRFIWKKAGQIEGVIINGKGIIGTWHYILKNNKVIFNVNLLNNNIDENKLEKSFKLIVKFLNCKDFLINYIRRNSNE